MKRHKFFYKNVYKNVYLRELDRIVYRYIRDNCDLNKFIRQRAFYSLMKLNANVNYSKLKTFCLLSGRIRFTITRFKLSRMNVKALASNSYIAGLYKAD